MPDQPENLEGPSTETQPIEVPAEEPVDGGSSHLHRLKKRYLDRKKWTIPASVLVIILILAAIPTTRYDIFGLVIKKNFTVQVLDSETNTPVSGADVSMAQKTVQTDSSGKAVLPGIKVGGHSLLIHKKYYSDDMSNSLVPLLSQKSFLTIKLKATGRQTKVTVKNLINQTPLSNVAIKVSGTTAKTDSNGQAIIVLPPGSTSQKASLSLAGYNDSSATIKVSDASIIDNQLNLTPAGKVYFLSKLSGKIDVVKTNLDGTSRQTVLAGTGNEDEQNTVLLASKDWKYLALLSRRAGGFATVYLIDTSNDSLRTIDEGNASFNLIGWSGHQFLYHVIRNQINEWQAGKEAIKSYDAAAKLLSLVDQTQINGTKHKYARQSFSWTLLQGNNLVYFKTWYAHHSNYGTDFPELTGRNAQLVSFSTSGNTSNVIKNYTLKSTSTYANLDWAPLASYQSQLYKPYTIYFTIDGPKGISYDSLINQNLAEDNQAAKDFLNKGTVTTTYLASPNSNNTFWSEPRDGKNTLFIGDEDGLNGKQTAILSDYNPYGWFTEDFLLVSKNGSELYIMPKDGSHPAIKISDYHKPTLNYYGYGGGYGGI